MLENEKKVIPYRIKQARVSRGLSMVELSELVSVSKQAISQYEMGKNAPSKAILNAIANILKYPVSFFFTNQFLLMKMLVVRCSLEAEKQQR